MIYVLYILERTTNVYWPRAVGGGGAAASFNGLFDELLNAARLKYDYLAVAAVLMIDDCQWKGVLMLVEWKLGVLKKKKKTAVYSMQLDN